MTTPAPLPFGEQLKRYRDASGLTQEELAEQAQLSANGISHLERGIRRNPHRDTVRLLADALDLSPEERACLLVLVRLCDHPADDPVASIQLIAELGAELQDLGPCSPIRLPPPPPLADESGAALD